MEVALTQLTNKNCTPCQGGVPALEKIAAEKLIAQLKGWSLIENHKKIQRKYTFADFAQALAFVNEIAAIAEDQMHHPDILFSWGYATITIYTHKINGLHENDFILADKIDQIHMHPKGIQTTI